VAEVVWCAVTCDVDNVCGEGWEAEVEVGGACTSAHAHQWQWGGRGQCGLMRTTCNYRLKIAAPAPTKNTASVKLAGGAEEATTTKPKALESWAESMVLSGLETTLPPSPQKGSGKPRLPLREALTEGMRRCRLEAPL
jgi:hypothetical protein